MSTLLPLRLSSLVAKEIHVQNKIVFSNPAVVLTGANTTLLFDRINTLEQEVGDLYANGGGGGGNAAPEIPFPSITTNGFEDLENQLLGYAPLNTTTAYNSFGRFSYSSLGAPLVGEAFQLPDANSETHFRILNETDLSIFPLTTILPIQYTNSDGVPRIFSMSSELITARKSKETWVFYNGA